MDDGLLDLSDAFASAADDGTAVFAAERPRLTGIAYRITGSLADADDVVQEAWLRFSKALASSSDPIERPAAWLTTVVARIALDHLKAARHDREVYVGPWLPEPIASDPLAVSRPGPEEMAEMASSLTLGFLHVLETLNPVERVIFVLADVFDVPFKDIAETVGKSPDACRQIASRARRRVQEARPHRYSPPDDEAARVVGEMLAATTAGDIDGLVRLLAEDAVLVSDGGAHKRAARHPIRGRDRLARFLANIGKRYSHATLEPVALNGELGIVIYDDGERLAAMNFEVANGVVCEVHVIVADEKLAALDRPVDML
ncbi:MAG TPA: RNA polymerase sigma factor SigJ [Acidimicrobiia bacterium]|nr:RNA polymerase sigma factor SigJ [Acidimicrobiia bacterium]